MTVSATVEARVAVCVCTYDRSQWLTRLLVRLQNMELTGLNPSAVELIVVDNDPNAETRAICARHAHSLPIHIHYVEESRPGITFARNRAVEAALLRGADFVAFIDDDDEPRKDWLIRLLDRQAVTGADLVFGTWELDPHMPDWAHGIFRSPTKAKNHNKGGRYGLPPCASTCNVLAGRDILQTVATHSGLVFRHKFKNSGGEDKDFFIRAVEAGARIESANTSVICRNHDPARYTAAGLLKRGFKNGCSQMIMAAEHGKHGRKGKVRGVAVLKLTISLILLPFCIFFKRNLMHNLYRAARACGVIYATLTGRSIAYYSHKEAPIVQKDRASQ